MIPCN